MTGDDTVQPQRSSWARVLGFSLGACALIAALMWAAGVRLPEGPASAGLPAALPSQSPPAEGDGGTDGGADPQNRKKKNNIPYHGPPVLSVQYVDTAEGTCPATFSGSLNIVVVKGEVSDVTSEIRIPKDEVTRTRSLIEVSGEWSTVLGGIPTKRTVQLVIMAKGPGGGTSITRDISHACPGEPMDKADPMDLSTKIAKQRIRDKMFDMDYDFSGKDKNPKGTDDN